MKNAMKKENLERRAKIIGLQTIYNRKANGIKELLAVEGIDCCIFDDIDMLFEALSLEAIDAVENLEAIEEDL